MRQLGRVWWVYVHFACISEKKNAEYMRVVRLGISPYIILYIYQRMNLET